MPTSIFSPTLTIHTTPLSQSTFAPFGTVIECPLPPTTTTFPSSLPETPNIVPANQNTALKYLNVTHMHNLYASAPSKIPSRVTMNMFSCFPRALPPPSTSQTNRRFDIKILERHPYTTQTFLPLTSPPPSLNSTASAKYLVIVASTLPSTSDSSFTSMGPPDLSKIRAFWAQRGQAVTYGAGTWHAPMVVIGDERMDFVVVQFANGVAEEDCQEVELKIGDEGRGLSVDLGDGGRDGRVKL